jgi:hypothetical protein
MEWHAHSRLFRREAHSVKSPGYLGERIGNRSQKMALTESVIYRSPFSEQCQL